MDTIYTRFEAKRTRSPTGTALDIFAIWLEACFARSRQRRDLALLTEDQLNDIGLTARDVAQECRRWPWDGAPHRVRRERCAAIASSAPARSWGS